MTKLISLADFRAELRAGALPGEHGASFVPPDAGIVRVQVQDETRAIDDGRRAIRFCFSDGSIDRMGDTIAPTGWNTGPFLKNPIALWAHDSMSPPIGKASHLVVEDERLMGDIEFAPPDLYPFADLIYRLCKEKYLNAVSVGFLPTDYSWSDDDDRGFGIDFKEQELLEISVVPVPANSNALADARAKGLDTGPLYEWAEKLLDGGGRVILPRAELELLRNQAKGSTKMTTKPKPGQTQQRDDDPMSETDPDSGGFTLSCGRSEDDERGCSLDEPEKCKVHGPGMKSGKGIARLVDGKLKTALVPILKTQAAILKALKALKGKKADDEEDPEDKSAEDPEDKEIDPEGGQPLDKAFAHHKDAGDAVSDMPDRGDDPEEHDKCVRSFHAHIKAADQYCEAYRRSMDDDHDVSTGDPEDETGKAADGDGDEDGDDEKAARLARVRALRAAA